MIWKLSLTGIKNRFKDYLVLFSGLVVASMIFYMFLTIAINPSFISKDIQAPTDYLNFIFALGIVLLIIISSVYLTYANSFLLNMRKHDYGMFMMLGAKSTRIGLLIFCETLVTGTLAMALGILLGFGLTALVSRLLIAKLHLTISHFQVILPAAILWTVIFFIVMFFLEALKNVHKLTRTPVIDLLHENQKPFKYRQHTGLRAIEALLGLVLLATGYYIMSLPGAMILFIIPAALITIVAGSYFTFNAFFSAIINFLIKKKSFSYHGIRIFTLGQLKFRLHDYTRMLTVISLLFALALGAITVGLNFNTLKDQVEENIYYDTTLVSTSPTVKKEVARLAIKSRQTYHYKENKAHLYFKRGEFTNKPVKNVRFFLKNGNPTYHLETLPIKKLDRPGTNANNAFGALVPNGTAKIIRLVSNAKWQKLKGQNKFVTFLKVENFKRDYPTLLLIQKQQLKENPAYDNLYSASKPSSYQFISSFSSGFEFMGFFLGFAFLTMLASTLMFKVLSGTSSDKARYKMLYQMGTQVGVLHTSIRQEIGTLFLLPAILGVIDVLFGLKLFRIFLPHPYNKIWIPFLIFLVLYLFYYYLTVKLYEKIVLDYEKNN
ncbi:FtsX-like permease family protein [Lactobacillus sp. ESL0228]|uniref:FtsX-like permease family protein n=1 Tax=Lactobacillus sp. ESL0228 TaxID=2069352 RepID=UPI000EFC48F5|nr:ABC transporter permease [Lactobacillus sp. ESL0228]RMC51927.1 FtsX-like permease family protein [Lactobacillus sp. ESL0228]